MSGSLCLSGRGGGVVFCVLDREERARDGYKVLGRDIPEAS